MSDPSVDPLRAGRVENWFCANPTLAQAFFHFASSSRPFGNAANWRARSFLFPRAITLAKPYGITAAMSLMAAVMPWSQSAKSTKVPNVSRPTSAAIGRPMASTGLERFARNRLTS
jgi:hypothetical protein